MSYILVPVIVVLMGMVVYSLVRGIIAFLKSTRDDLDRGDAPGASEMQLLQNKMMFNRIKYQAAAVLVVVLLLAIAKS
ncbi:HIG1 domain-containing protein [Novosphingobium flavum]|uniref:HIG1 domain-containing protein n=1 Tax=Novosphingobium flavum TaxID=1778672 RepID=A0A7X1FRB3_9SPHN|nr:HIG1 domain-containing protein [Novosphingobium flavum]MBC2665087.1 HIG1 domain-containing protein [Novosphingobium flavum]